MNENFADMGGILGGIPSVQPGGLMPQGGQMMGDAVPGMMSEMTPDLSAILGTSQVIEEPEIRGR